MKLAAAAELNRCGQTVTVYERDEGPGGLMRFGVPDAKLEKWIIDRRVDILAAEGKRKTIARIGFGLHATGVTCERAPVLIEQRQIRLSRVDGQEMR